jgi:hypothetical protein|tara:strand:+ start:162 stop:593 length:432 start_codon:yes stop_codon:yes gene_type:complete
MKLYPKKLKINEINNKKMEHLEKYKQSEFLNHTFYSKDGIFKYFNNQLYELFPIDFKTFNASLANENTIIDKSYLKKTNLQYQIPYNHFIECVQESQYKILPKSNLILIIEKKEDTIENIYFSCFDYKKIDENELDIFFKILF